MNLPKAALFFQVPIVLSAFLLFLLQPIIAKQILPWFGGSAGVWNTCLFFFQVTLLLGYAYAHGLVTWCSPRQQALIHLGLLVASLISLPILASPHWKVSGFDPTPGILLLLVTTVGLPYAVLSSTTPLLQAWFARTEGEPYRLFALSNAASLGGLLAYPFLIEPNLTVVQQAWAWSAGFVCFALACSGVAAYAAKPVDSRSRAEPGQSLHPARGQTGSAGLWILLSSLGCLALISVTSFVAQNIASIPLIWVVPLSIYLITFVLAFGSRSYRGWVVGGPALVLSLGLVLTYRSEEFTSDIALSLPLVMACLFFVCLYCHGELAASKPAPGKLTYFYIMVSLGGALGSLFGSILAPLLLPGDFEMPITLAVVGVAFLYRHWHDRLISRAFATALATMLAITSGWQILIATSEAKLLARNFYSSLRIVDIETSRGPLRKMEHGGVEHGSQLLDPQQSHRPVSYYGPTSGVALAIQRQREVAGRPISAGLVGLGAGALAAYGEEGDRYRFYEINPQVIELARTHFTYLKDSKASVTTALGDARLVLESEAPQNFDLLAIDAFSGGGIPMHLLTREALLIYRKHLASSGVLLFHISNKFVDLEPALSRLSADQGMSLQVVADEPEGAEDDASPLSASTWVLIAANAGWFNSPALRQAAEVPKTPKAAAVWTDDFNDILSAVSFAE